VKNSDINIALFARYRVNKWEIHGGGWHSPEDDVSNLTVGGGSRAAMIFDVGQLATFTTAMARASSTTIANPMKGSI